MGGGRRIDGDLVVSELAAAATRCLSADEFYRESLSWIDRAVGIDGANLVGLEGLDVRIKQTRGIEPSWAARFHQRIDGFRTDLGSLMEASLALGGSYYGDTCRLEHWAARPGRQGFEEEMAFPLGFRIGSVVMVMMRGAARAVLFLARAGRARVFSRAEADLLARIAPIVALGAAVHEGARPAPPVESLPAPAPRRLALTARERAVVELLVLGLVNREIGLALGVSPHTVRNQLAAIFQKLSVGSRAELVAVALTEGLVEAPRPTGSGR